MFEVPSDAPIVVKKLGASSGLPLLPPEETIFTRRIDCWHHTLALCKSAVSPPTQPSRKYTYSDAPMSRTRGESSIEIFDEDTIDCAMRMAATGRDPLVLNLADDDFAGGCVFSGSGAQEESLFRRTNYCQTLLQDMYPIEPTEAIYSPGVRVLKRSEAENWAALPDTDKNLLLNFVACPAVKYPITEMHNKERRLSEEDAAALEDKIRLIVQIAAANGHDTVIFGAMGCGAWNCPPKHVAEIFKEVLQELNGVIAHYVFAILTTNAVKDSGEATCAIVFDNPRRKKAESTFSVFSKVFA